MHPLYQKPEGLEPLLDICYGVAEEAHDKIMRTKQGGQNIPYITHPTIVYKLLRSVGVDDPITLAAAFLHDVQEDCEPYKKPGALTAELTKRFTAAGIPDAAKKAYMIAHLCDELTNAEEMQEGKRGWQWEHGHHLSGPAKQIKIADQAASLVDDILLPSDRSYDKLRKFNMKALECAKACAGENELLDKFFKVVFSDGMAVMDGEKKGASPEAAGKAKAIRRDFSLEKALERAHQAPGEKRDEPPVRWKKHPSLAEAQMGIVSVGITAGNKVCRFAALVDPHLDEDSPCNSAIISVMQDLEAQSPSRCTYRPLEIMEDRVVRSFKLKPPMELAEFVQRATRQHAMDEHFAQLAVQPVTAAKLKN